jgi:hypothetical protein
MNAPVLMAAGRGFDLDDVDIAAPMGRKAFDGIRASGPTSPVEAEQPGRHDPCRSRSSCRDSRARQILPTRGARINAMQKVKWRSSRRTPTSSCS